MEAKVNMSKSLITYRDPGSPASEAYRSIRTNIYYRSIDNTLKTIVITSPEPADGKTTTAANLAISMAQTGQKVILVDGDLRCPKLHQYFNVLNSKGLTSIIHENKNLSEAIRCIPEIDGLHLLTSGPITPFPSEILNSKKFRNLIPLLKEQFDVILFDMPPAVHFTDASIVAGLSDGVLLVVSSNKTNVQMTRLAKKNLLDVHARILGVVLTKVVLPKKNAYYHYYKSSS